MAFLMAVLVGAKRFAHADRLRGDQALHALLGMERFPTDDTIRNLFRKFRHGRGPAVLRTAGGVADGALAAAAEGYTLDWIPPCSSAMASRKAR